MFLNRLKQGIASIPVMKLYHLFIALFFLRHIWRTTPLKIPIILLALINVFYTNDRLERYSVLFYVLNFLGLWYISYYVVANHHFLLGIFTLYIAYRVWFQDQRWNYPRYLITLVIVIATIQKLLSSYFLNGNLMAELIVSGTSIPRLASFLDPDYHQNAELFKQSYYGNKWERTNLDFIISDSTILLAKLMTYIITITEIGLSLILIWGSQKLRYWSFFLFLALTAIFRSEFGFFCIMSLIACFDVQMKRFAIHTYFKLLFLCFLCIFYYLQFGIPLLHFIEN